MSRRYLMALSFVNLCYAPVWKHLLDIRAQAEFTMQNLPARGEYLAAMCGVLICSAILVSVDISIRRGPRMLRSGEVACALALMVLPVQSMLAGYPIRSSLIHSVARLPVLLVSLAAAIAIAVFLVRYQPFALRAAAATLIALVPFAALTFGMSLYRLARPQTLPPSHIAAPLPPTPGPRVLWIIFDEWDQRLSFTARPAGLEMTAIDRLRSESLSAENALPPGNATLISMTSFISGRQVRAATLVDSNSVLLNFGPGQWQRFGDEPNLFSEVRKMGINSAVLGWYLPYCRVLGPYLSDCSWDEMDAVWNSAGTAFWPALVNQPRSLIETSIFSPFGQSLTTLKHVRIFQHLMNMSKRVASDRNVRLALIHLNIPHPPFFYDRVSREMTRGNSLSAYSDALALVDRTFAELREDMEKTGAWQSTTLLVSSDHFFRSSPLVDGKRDERVPFIVHFPGETGSASYSRSFNTVVTHDLIRALLDSSVSDVKSAEAWLDRH